MRLNEICQLYLDDIGEEEGILCFKLTNKRDDQSIKSLSGERLVPVHLKLIEHGLKDYIDLMKRGRSDRLFPKFKYNEANHYSHQATKWFSRTFMGKLEIEEGNKSFHSFRHSMITLLRIADVEEPKIIELVGQSQKSIAFSRYSKGFSVRQLNEAVNKYEI